MSFDFVEEEQIIPDYNGICPECGNKLTFWHDMKCQLCDQKLISFCPQCERHLKLKLEANSD